MPDSSVHCCNTYNSPINESKKLRPYCATGPLFLQACKVYISTSMEGQVTVAIDELWTEFRQMCAMRGWFPVASPIDWQAAYPAWSILDGEQKVRAMECIRGPERPFLVGESIPVNFLRDRKFLRAAPRNGRTVVPMSHEEREKETEATRVFLAEQILRDEYAEWRRQRLYVWVVAHVNHVVYTRDISRNLREVRKQYPGMPPKEVYRIAEQRAQERWENEAAIPTFEEWRNATRP